MKSGLFRIVMAVIPLVGLIICQPSLCWAEVIQNIEILGNFGKANIDTEKMNWSLLLTSPTPPLNQVRWQFSSPD